ncbi:GNAT family N-acetyltransferase [Williamsia sp. CHRR-6]|uniref:GNAT family N-acetyltransferase n=1 Tax=Williamsia sp. CHRR-6 TaxID=2835871 RepID=UPI001BD94907|nr:GNAT family N-acetyltransferase [Williamsia sp. CHRR-6]MBT0567398.1 GNAT family N-acetyltransferase [Williamsia sp. CHRR-6]
MTTVHTARLILRPYRDADAPRVLDILSRHEVIRWLGDPPYVPMPDIAAARAWVTRQCDSEASDPLNFRRAIEIRETGVVAGTVLIAPAVRRDGGFVGEYEVGWHLHPDSTGHGYATEAARAIIDMAFARGATELWCDMFPDNHRSAAVADRLGLSLVGVMPDPWYEGDGRIYRVAREQWENIHP